MSERHPHIVPLHVRTVFLGSSTFSVPVLEALLGGPVDVATVVTRPDRAAGRGRKPRATPVKTFAGEHGLCVWEPERITAPEAVARLRELSPELLVLAAYGQILSADVLAAPSVAALNVHPSLLPRYRGAAPIAWALIRGERETGVTIICMNEQVDAGLIVAQERTPIGREETAGQLEVRLARVGGQLLLATLARLEEALSQARAQGPPPQDGSADAPRLAKADGLVDWGRPAEELCNRVRGLTPWPGAYSFLHHGHELLRVKVLRARAAGQEEPSGQPPGTVVEVKRDALVVETGRGVLELREVQPAGGRAMEVSEFLRGHQVSEGDRFVSGQ